jgi:hemerythrin-like domain-containing protein
MEGEQDMSRFPQAAIAEHDFAEHEHREIAQGIDRLHRVARFVGSVAAPDTSIALTEVLDWIELVLEPHATWEDGWLYPQIDRLAGTPWATRLMSYEHQQIRALTRQLEAVQTQLMTDHSQALAMELRGLLFGIEALIRAHLEREERFLLPVLESGNDGDLIAMRRANETI